MTDALPREPNAAISREELLKKLRGMMPDPLPRFPNSDGGYAVAIEQLIEWVEAYGGTKITDSDGCPIPVRPVGDLRTILWPEDEDSDA